MAPNRTYNDGCAAAHALDLLGERWALLVVRELLLGPKRFTDLRAGLNGVGPNVLSQRLRELEEAGVVVRRKLGPPVGSRVYDLTEWGHGLRPVLVQLGRWGSRSPRFDIDAERSVDSLMLAQWALFDPGRSGTLRATYALHIGDDRFSVRVADGRIDIGRGDPPDPDAVVATDTRTLAGLMAKKEPLGQAVDEGRVKVSGDVDAVERWLGTLAMPEKAQPVR